MRWLFLTFSSACLCFASTIGFANSFFIPVEPFFERYVKAETIVMGDLEGPFDGASRIPDFQDLDPRYIKKWKIKKPTFLKGARKGSVEFFAYVPPKLESTPERAKRASEFAPKRKFLVFLRSSSDALFAETLNGTVRIWSDPGKVPEYNALKELNAGVPMAEAIKRLRKEEIEAFEESKSKSK